MSLIELVIAFAILMMVLVPVAMLLSNTIGQAASSRQRLTALSLAEQYIEKLNNTPVLLNTTTATAHRAIETTTNHTIPKTDVSVKVGSSVHSTVRYAIYARFTWALAQGATPDLCTVGTAPTLLDLQVTVEWGRGTQKITDTTLINFPATGILTEGFLAIEVDGDPVSGPPADAGGHPWATRVLAVPVTIKPGTTVTTGFATITRYPNKFGCVFQEVPPGKFTVTVADPSSGTPAGTHYGTPSWASSYDELVTETAPSQAAVTVGDVTTVTFQYDEGAMAKVTYPSTTIVEGAVACPGVGSIDCLAAGQSPASASAPGSTPVADLSVLTPSGWNVYKTAATRLVASACAGSKRCVSVGSARTGSNVVGASVSSGTATVAFTSDSMPSGVTDLAAITCPTTAKCFAYGKGTSGAVILSAAVTATSVTWQSDTGLTAVTTVHSLSCLGATKCYAAVSTSSATAILSLSGGTSWVHDTLPTKPSAVTGITQLTCRTSTCFALGTKSGGALILSQSATSATKWIEDTIPAATTLTSIKCPTVTHCYAIGSSGTSPKIESLISVTGTTVKWTSDSLPATITALTLLKCPGTSACFATGSTATGPAIVSLYHSTSNWAIDSLPAGVTALTGLTCPTSTQCAATAVATVSGSQGAVVLSLSSATAWKKDTFPATTPLYLAGIACSAAESICAAPGATATAAVLLSATFSGATWHWHKAAPSGVTGMYLGDTPIAVYNSGLTPTTTVEVASPSTGDVSTIGPLFPFASGYEVAAAGCAAEVTSTAPTITSVPGTTLASAPTAALTMGLLPLEVESATGSPVAGATVTIKPTCARLTPPSGQSNQTSFALGTTDGAGLTGLDVMYGTYKVTAKSGATTVTATVTVSATSVKVGTTTTMLPTPAVVQL